MHGVTEQLHQMNITYHPGEDRLLLRISSRTGDEYRLWLTRRYTGLLVNLLRQEMVKSGGEPALAASDETRNMIKGGAFRQTFDDNSVSFPLGEKGVLGFRINSRISNEGILNLEMLPEAGQGVSLNLNKPLLYMLHNLLNQGIDQAGWNLLNPSGESTNVH